jgi:hypothetical protein
MDIERAVEILGINRRRDGDLRPMVKALELFPRLNDEDEKVRLEAAKFVLRRWDTYQAECNFRRSFRKKVA